MYFNSPISSEKADSLIELFDLETGSRILDVGCGTGEFLARAVRRYSASGVGVDLSPDSLREARERAEKMGCSEAIQLMESSILDVPVQEPFDCAICLGATHAYSLGEPAYSEALKHLGESVREGGLLLVGESFWRREPPREYVEFVGQPIGTYRTHRENVEMAAEFGWFPLYSITSSQDEWDDFEWRHHMRIEEAAESEPGNQDLIKRRDFGRQWRSAYLQWGRDCLGFGFYLFAKK